MISIIPVLFIDDNKELCTLFQLYLEETGNFSVHTCSTGDEALEYLADHQVMAIISDYDMPEMNGIDLLRQIRQSYPGLPFIMLTGNDSKETAIAALNAGADFYQNKSEDFEVQVLDLSHKILVLSGRHKAEESARKKGEILAAISYAAERLLRGNGWQGDMQEILAHLGKATSAGKVFIAAFDGSSGFQPGTVIWTDQDHKLNNYQFNSDKIFHPLHPVHSWWKDPVRYTKLANHQEILVSLEFLSDEEQEIFGAEGVGTLLLIPVFIEERWWGVLGITDPRKGRIFSTEEVHALRMAAGVIGSARYRLYIEDFFRNPVEQSLVGVFMVREDQFLYVNPRFNQIFGWSSRDALKKFNPSDIIHPESWDRVKAEVKSVISGRKHSIHLEFTGKRSDGTRIYLELYLTSILCDGFSCLIGNVMDVTERCSAQIALSESEERFRELFTNINDLIFIHEPLHQGGRILEVNQSVPTILHYLRDEILFRTLPSFCPEEHEREICEVHCREAEEYGKATCETVFLRSNGYAIPVEMSTHRVILQGQNVLLSVARDITDRVQAESKIRAGEELLKRNMLLSLREKETLLREIHHRVKNNMQIIISLLKLQDYKSDDPRVHEIIRDCRSRIYSMAVIHEMLYQTDELTSIRLGEYFKDIGERVISEFEPGSKNVHLFLEGEADVLVDINIGIPLGLIINELITNCMKYAFPEDASGNITVKISKKLETLTILVKDTGVGLPEEFDPENISTLGIELIKGLAFQLGGTASWESNNGTTCIITILFPVPCKEDES